MTDEQRPSTYLDPYRDAVRDVGAKFEALLWHSREAQAKRFAAKAGLIDLTGRVVADLGCGRADFASFLHTNRLAYGAYIGVDGVPEMIQASTARARKERLPNCTFRVADFVADEGLFADLVARDRARVLAFSGSLNTLEQVVAERVLDRAWDALRDAAGSAVVFNFLSDRHADGNRPATKPAIRFDTHRMVGWALDRTPLVAFRQDYLAGHDATIVMSRPA